MTRSKKFELVLRKRKFPRVGEGVCARKPQLFPLQQPQETREAHVAPDLMVIIHRLIQEFEITQKRDCDDKEAGKAERRYSFAAVQDSDQGQARNNGQA